MKMACKFFLVFFLFVNLTGFVFSQSWKKASTSEKLQLALDSLKIKYPDVVNNPAKYRLKIIYTEVNRNEFGAKTELVGFRTDENEFLYPTSAIKLPVALIALEKLELLKLNYPKLELNSRLKFIQKKGVLPSKSQVVLNGLYYYPSLDFFMKQMIGVSDNDAYNYLFEFNGQELLVNRLKELKYNNARITRKYLLNCSLDQNRISDSMVFFGNRSELIYSKPVTVFNDSMYGDSTFKLGKSYVGLDKKNIERPFDFSKQNYIDVLDLHKTLQGVIFPESKSAITYNLNENHRKFILKQLSLYPQELGLKYSELQYYPTYTKFNFFGRDSRISFSNDSLFRFRSFNVSGISFGCVIDASYMIDVQKGKEFILTIGMYANTDEVVNDNNYDYERIAYPFMKELGRIIMRNTPDNSFTTDYLKSYLKQLEILVK